MALHALGQLLHPVVALSAWADTVAVMLVATEPATDRAAVVATMLAAAPVVARVAPATPIAAAVAPVPTAAAVAVVVLRSPALAD